ncbi:MAG: hypothetical protein J6T74_08800, partial [Clostridia bacterium]|nr:hypothetical protein [Clostridia bacterium]
MLSEAEYKQEWLNGLHQTDYNNCRFAEDKTQFSVDWIKNKLPNVNLENPQNLIDRINWCKIYDKDERKPLWADKILAHQELSLSPLKDIV